MPIYKIDSNNYISSLNINYFTLITQKAHGTYKRILEGVDVGVLCP